MSSPKSISSGTIGWKRQLGSSYPDAYYGYNIPLEDKYFKEYLSKKDIKMTHPLASGYAFSNSYAPAGGVTEGDLLQRSKLRRACHPHLPSRQNQTSYVLDSHIDTSLCPYDGVSEEREVGGTSEEGDVISEEGGVISEEEVDNMAEELAGLEEERQVEEEGLTELGVSSDVITPSEINAAKCDIDNSVWFAIGLLVFLIFYFSRR